MDLAGRVKRDTDMKKQKQGVFGTTAAAMAVTECNGKGFNHLHALLNAIVPSWVLQAASSFKQLHGALGRLIDSCITAQLPPLVHLQSLLASLLGFTMVPTGIT